MHTFSELEELIKRSKRFRAPARTCYTDLKEEFKRYYRDVLQYDEDELECAMADFDHIVRRYEILFRVGKEDSPEPISVIKAFLDDVRKRWYASYIEQLPPEKKDKKPEFVYPREVVLLVSILTGMLMGSNDCNDVAAFWAEHNIELQLLIPNMPSPRHMICAETVRKIRSAMSQEEVEKLFIEYFNEIKNELSELFTWHPDKEELELPEQQPYLRTLGFDGQEWNSTYRSGVHSRKQKGCQEVSIYDCDNQVIVSYRNVEGKNQEAPAFIKMADQIEFNEGQDIVICDSLNNSEPLRTYLREHHIHGLLPFKTNLGHKPLNRYCRTVFPWYATPTEEQLSKGMLFYQCTRRESGRVVQQLFYMLPRSAFPQELLERYPEMQSIICYQTITQRVLKKTKEPSPKASKMMLFYMCTLECNRQNFKQCIHSINIRWNYEAHHHVLDCTYSQDAAQLCDKSHIACKACLNNITFNIMTYVRQELTASGHDRIKHRPGTVIKPLSFKQATRALNNDAFRAFRYLMKYFMKRVDETVTNEEYFCPYPQLPPKGGG